MNGFLIVVLIVVLIKFFVEKKNILKNGFILSLVLGLEIFFTSPEVQNFGAKIGGYGYIGLTRNPFTNTTKSVIKNNSNTETEEQKIIFSSNSAIEKVDFKEGKEYINMIGGGQGKSYVIYEVNLPPLKIVRANIISSDSITVAPIENSEYMYYKK